MVLTGAEHDNKESTMKFRLALAALLVTTGAFAQGAAPTPTPTPEASAAPSAAPVTYHLDVDGADLAAISQALNELPKRIADPLIAKLNAQLKAQTEGKK